MAHARAQLADPLYDPVLAALDRPSHADVLTLAAPGEVIYLWQMRKERQGQGDPVPNDDVLPDWTDLPTILSNALDREYAKYVNTTGPMKKVVPIVINVGLGVEMRYVWMKENLTHDDDGNVSVKKTKTGRNRGQYLLVRFNRESLSIQLDAAPWAQVRCVKITHAGDEAIQQGAMSDLLKHRLAVYIDDVEEEDSPEQDDHDDGDEGDDRAGVTTVFFFLWPTSNIIPT